MYRNKINQEFSKHELQPLMLKKCIDIAVLTQGGLRRTIERRAQIGAYINIWTPDGCTWWMGRMIELSNPTAN